MVLLKVDHKELLIKALERDKQEHVKLLQEFIRAPSPNPPGQTKQAADVLTDYLSSKDVPFALLDPQANGQPNIVSEFHGGAGPGPRVVLNGHIDVFPAGDRGSWPRDPWSGDVEGDRIYGRGVVDMKSGTASLVIAYTYLYHRRQFLKGSVALCAVSDEETGGKWGTAWLIQQDRLRWGGDVMLGAEPGGCETLRFSEKGTLRLSGTVRTKAAHGAYTNLSKGAIRTGAEFLNELIEAVEAMPVDLPGDMADQLKRPEVVEAIDRVMGAGSAAIIARPTVNVGTIKGGQKVNMIPDTCVFELDIRLPVGLLAEQVYPIMDSVVSRFEGDATTIEIKTQAAASNPYSYSSLNHPIVNCLIENAENVSPGWSRPIAVPSMGATDCKHYRYAGIAAYVYGCSPRTMASVDEWASVEEFWYVTKVHAAATWDFLQILHN